MRLGLKTSIIASGKSQRQIAAETQIHPNRLSELVQGWAEPRVVRKNSARLDSHRKI
jgi:hypothetical protein